EPPRKSAPPAGCERRSGGETGRGDHLFQPVEVRDQRILVDHAYATEDRRVLRPFAAGAVELEHRAVHADELREALGHEAEVARPELAAARVEDDHASTARAFRH